MWRGDVDGLCRCWGGRGGEGRGCIVGSLWLWLGPWIAGGKVLGVERGVLGVLVGVGSVKGISMADLGDGGLVVEG